MAPASQRAPLKVSICGKNELWRLDHFQSQLRRVSHVLCGGAFESS